MTSTRAACTAPRWQTSNPDVPVCTDCHGVHHQDDPTTAAFRLKSPSICANCHGNAEMMQKYGISTDVMNTYVADFHGTTVTLFEKQSPDQQTNKAVCTDCHGIHDIKKVTSADATVVKQNLLTTCQKCHPDATTNFPDSWVGHWQPSATSNPLVYYVNLFYKILIPTVIGGMGLFVSIDACPPHLGSVPPEERRLSDVTQHQQAVRALQARAADRTHRPHRSRSAPWRLTGLIQKYSLNPVCDALIKALGGIENTRVIHHAAAVVFVLQTIYHFVLLAYKVFVQHTELTMLPGVRDATDALSELRYNLGLTKQRPSMPRYNFVEKTEYWAMIWGTLVMAATGFMLWNPIFITRLFPGQIIPAAKAAHGGEAVLAVLAILDLAHVQRPPQALQQGHVDRQDVARRDGRGTRPRNWPGSSGATSARGPARQVVRRRQRVFFPVMAPIALLLIGGVVWLTQLRKDGHHDGPAAFDGAGVCAVADTATPASSGVASVGPAIPHDIAGKDQCDTCHGQGKIKPYPADHVGRPNESCQACHKPGPTSTPASAAGQASGSPVDIPHPIAGREKCEMCHAAGGIKPVPADHAGRTSDTCTACHKLSPGISGTPREDRRPLPRQPGHLAPAAGRPPRRSRTTSRATCTRTARPVTARARSSPSRPTMPPTPLTCVRPATNRRRPPAAQLQTRRLPQYPRGPPARRARQSCRPTMT